MEVYAAGTAAHILVGKDFDRGMEACKMLEEVLLTQFYIQFKAWCTTNGIDIPLSITDGIEEVNKAFNSDSLVFKVKNSLGDTSNEL